jgi:hypothetical protein
MFNNYIVEFQIKKVEIKMESYSRQLKYDKFFLFLVYMLFNVCIY